MPENTQIAANSPSLPHSGSLYDKAEAMRNSMKTIIQTCPGGTRTWNLYLRFVFIFFFKNRSKSEDFFFMADNKPGNFDTVEQAEKM